MQKGVDKFFLYHQPAVVQIEAARTSIQRQKHQLIEKRNKISIETKELEKKETQISIQTEMVDKLENKVKSFKSCIFLIINRYFDGLGEKM